MNKKTSKSYVTSNLASNEYNIKYSDHDPIESKSIVLNNTILLTSLKSKYNINDSYFIENIFYILDDLSKLPTLSILNEIAEILKSNIYTNNSIHRKVNIKTLGLEQITYGELCEKYENQITELKSDYNKESQLRLDTEVKYSILDNELQNLKIKLNSSDKLINNLNKDLKKNQDKIITNCKDMDEMELSIDELRSNNLNLTSELHAKSLLSKKLEVDLIKTKNELNIATESLEQQFTQFQKLQYDHFLLLEKTKKLRKGEIQFDNEEEDIVIDIKTNPNALSTARPKSSGRDPWIELQLSNNQIIRLKDDLKMQKNMYSSLKSTYKNDMVKMKMLADQVLMLVEENNTIRRLNEEHSKVLTPRPNWTSIYTQNMHLCIDQINPQKNVTKSSSTQVKFLFEGLSSVHRELAAKSEEIESLNERIGTSRFKSFDNAVDTVNIRRPLSALNTNKYFFGIGIGNDIPKYLRYNGRIRHKHFSLRETKLIIREIWQSKRELESKLERVARTPLDEFLFIYLKRKYGLQSLVAETAYNFLEALEIYKWYSECELFVKILKFSVTEDVYWDQSLMLETFREFLKIADLAQNGKLTGVLSKTLIVRQFRVFFPFKKNSDFTLLENALFRDKDEEQTINYDSLIDDPVDHPSEIMECLRVQHLFELQDFISDISDVVYSCKKDLSASLSSIQSELQKLDCSLALNDIATVIKGVMGYQKYDDTVQIYPDLFIYRLQREFPLLKRYPNYDPLSKPDVDPPFKFDLQSYTPRIKPYIIRGSDHTLTIEYENPVMDKNSSLISLLNSPPPYIYLTSVPVNGSKRKVIRSPQPNKDAKQASLPANSKSKVQNFRNKSRHLIMTTPLPDVVYKPKIETFEVSTPDQLYIADTNSTPIIKTPLDKKLEVKQLPFLGSPVIFSAESVKIKRAATYSDLFSSYRSTNFEKEISKSTSIENEIKMPEPVEEIKLLMNSIPQIAKADSNIPEVLDNEHAISVIPATEHQNIKTEGEEFRSETLILNVICEDSNNLPEIPQMLTSASTSVGFTPSPAPSLGASIDSFNIWTGKINDQKENTLNSSEIPNKKLIPLSPIFTSYPRLAEKKDKVANKLIDAPIRRQAK